jgi:hypothetical protein
MTVIVTSPCLLQLQCIHRPSATALPRHRKCGPPYYDPKGDSPLSLHATVSASKVGSHSASEHREEEEEEEEEEESLFKGGGRGGKFIQS